MLKAANVSWHAQDRIVVHYTESFSVSEAILQTPRQQAALAGFHNGAAAETKGPNGKGHVLADHGGDGLMSGQTRNFPPVDGYVECAYGGFGEGCRKRDDFVPDMDLPDGWFTKDGNSYCSEHSPMVRR
jgi:hypothetical protein